MNCKPGDLAVIVVGRLAGVVVRVTSFDPIPSPDGAVFWLYEGEAIALDGERYESLRDSVLRPIRDNDGEDETLTWAGKPSDIKTPEAA